MTISTKNVFGRLVLCVVLAAGAMAMAQDASPVPAPDNTSTNKRDRDSSQPTADQQKENRSDKDITRDIRRSIVDDKSLSTYAHNVKIICQNGMVTLKGPVQSEEEKSAIEVKAKEVVGKDNVTSQLEVQPKQ